jgi:hypothetical protein
MGRRTMAMVLAALWIAAVAGCNATLRATGPAPEVERVVIESMLGDWPGGECRMLGSEAMFESAPASNPGAGVLTFGIAPPGDFIKGRIVEVRIVPWDDRPGAERRIRLAAGQGSLLREARRRIESGLAGSVAADR